MKGKSILIIALLIASPALGETGKASWYGGGEKLNQYTASGQEFNPEDLTCASYQWPMGTRLRVTNQANNKTVTVIINDLGPAKRLNRMIDLTRRAFSMIADLRRGVITVKVEVIG